MVNIVILPDGKTETTNPKDVWIIRNRQNEELCKILEKAKKLSEKEEQNPISTNTIIVQKASRFSVNMNQICPECKEEFDE